MGELKTLTLSLRAIDPPQAEKGVAISSVDVKKKLKFSSYPLGFLLTTQKKRAGLRPALGVFLTVDFLF
jgi:hypothetical protein